MKPRLKTCPVGPLTRWSNSTRSFMNETPGMPMNPLVREFLSFVLSREGQAEIIARERTKLEKAWSNEP